MKRKVRDRLPDHPDREAAHDAPQDYPQSRRTAKVLRLRQDRPWPRRGAGSPWRWTSSPAATAEPSARDVTAGGRATTGCRRGASSSCRSGGSRCSSSTPCAASIARSAASKSRRSPGATGRAHLTTTYGWFLAGWAKRLSWQEVAEAFHTSWEKVFRAVKYAVDWGLRAPHARRGSGHRRRRGAVAARAPVPDVGLPDRRRGAAAAVGRPGPDRGQLAGVLPDV